jgi:Leucine-rich repeat (LRR) protein
MSFYCSICDPDSNIEIHYNRKIEVDFCNYFFAFNLLKRSLLPLKHTNQFGQVVYRVQLNRTKLNELGNEFFHSEESLVEKWSSYLPGLTKLKWHRLAKTMFQHLVNLEELKLSSINPEEVDSNTFACNNNLRKLEISSEKLSLNSQSFNGLVNLTELDLSSNQIAALPDGLFDSCTALKIVNLSNNYIIKLETSTFQNLVNLEELNLSSNSIIELDSALFLCNKKLIKLKFNKNKITQLNKDFLRGLCQLTHLHLADNEIVSLPECPFDSCLKVVNLSHNKFLILETSTFENLINLEELDLSINYIERVDYSNILARNKNLRKLNISYNCNTSSSSLNNQSFYGLNLTELNLQSCQIMDLTEKLFDGLVNLTGLYLRFNGIINLPDFIFQNLTILKHLDLSRNQISQLPVNLFKSLVNLENLDLGENEITNIPMGLFDNLNSLKFLHLETNKIEFQEDSDPNIFVGLRKLTGLNLNYNQISILPDGIFHNLVSLEGLGLAYNHIMSFPKEFPKEDLVSSKSLKPVRNRMLTEDGNKWLYIELKNIKPFQIDLSDNDDSDEEDSTDEMLN